MSVSSSKHLDMSGFLPRNTQKKERRKDLTALIKSGQLTVDQWRRINKKGRSQLRNEAATTNSDVKVIFVNSNNNDLVKEKSSTDTVNKPDNRLTADQWNEMYYKRHTRPVKREGFLEKFGLQNRGPSTELFQCNNSIPQKYCVDEDCCCFKCLSKKSPTSAQRPPLTSNQWTKLKHTVDGKFNEMKNGKWNYAGNPLQKKNPKKHSNTNIVKNKDKLQTNSIFNQTNSTFKHYSTEHQFSKYIELVDGILANGGKTKPVSYPKATVSSKTIMKNSNDQLSKNLSQNKTGKTEANKHQATICNKSNSRNDRQDQQPKSIMKQWRFPAFQGSWRFFPTKQTQNRSTSRKSPAAINNANANNNSAKLDTASSKSAEPANSALLLSYLSSVIKQPSIVNEWSQIFEVIRSVLPNENEGSVPTKDSSKTQSKNNCHHSIYSGNSSLADQLCKCTRERGSILIKPGYTKSKNKSRVSFEDSILTDLLAWDYGSNGMNLYRSLSPVSVNKDNSVKRIMAYPPSTSTLSNSTYNFAAAKKWFLCKSSNDALNAKNKRYSFSKLNRIAKKINVDK